MKKKILAFVGIIGLSISISMTAIAAPAYSWSRSASNAMLGGYGACGNGYRLMWDDDGSFMEKDAFESRIDSLIEDGYILDEDKDYYLEQYDWCASYGRGSSGVRGGGRGRGMGCCR